MNTHSSASVRVETPHEIKHHAQSVINDTSIDPQWRNIVRYAPEIDDPMLPDLVRRAHAGESIIDTIETLETNEDHSTRDKLEALVDIICGVGGAQAAGAVFVLMGPLQNSTEPEALAHVAKHFAFTRCGELNLNGMVDAQLAVVEGELLAGTALRS